ncbi:MAG: hypothetical protein KDD53_04965 [Bdellovibrionales bacterium]|nr:hypothetical protein [Bdellovibrionales bacterium]
MSQTLFAKPPLADPATGTGVQVEIDSDLSLGNGAKKVALFGSNSPLEIDSDSGNPLKSSDTNLSEQASKFIQGLGLSNSQDLGEVKVMLSEQAATAVARYVASDVGSKESQDSLAIALKSIDPEIDLRILKIVSDIREGAMFVNKLTGEILQLRIDPSTQKANYYLLNPDTKELTLASPDGSIDGSNLEILEAKSGRILLQVNNNAYSFSFRVDPTRITKAESGRWQVDNSDISGYEIVSTGRVAGKNPVPIETLPPGLGSDFDRTAEVQELRFASRLQITAANQNLISGLNNVLKNWSSPDSDWEALASSVPGWEDLESGNVSKLDVWQKAQEYLRSKEYKDIMMTARSEFYGCDPRAYTLKELEDLLDSTETLTYPQKQALGLYITHRETLEEIDRARNNGKEIDAFMETRINGAAVGMEALNSMMIDRLDLDPETHQRIYAAERIVESKQEELRALRALLEEKQGLPKGSTPIVDTSVKGECQIRFVYEDKKTRDFRSVSFRRSEQNNSTSASILP